jgi:hypothetical protein
VGFIVLGKGSLFLVVEGGGVLMCGCVWGCRKANAIGRSSKTVREFLERNYKEDMDREETIKLTVKSLLEVVQTGAKNIEIAIMEPGKEMEVCLPPTPLVTVLGECWLTRA